MSDLLPGWKSKVDPKGRTYYYHKDTKETTWEKPVAQAEEDEAEEEADEEQEKEEEPLPEGWAAKEDPKGRTYYYHKKTKETTWSRPSAKKAEAEEPKKSSKKAAANSDSDGDSEPLKLSLKGAAKPAADDAPLPEGWRSKQYPKGRTYYYHKDTKETTWDRPAAPKAAGGSQKKPSGESKGGNEKLPEGWKSAVDDKGRTYYYNKATKQKSWDIPTAEDGSDADADEEEEEQPKKAAFKPPAKPAAKKADSESEGNESEEEEVALPTKPAAKDAPKKPLAKKVLDSEEEEDNAAAAAAQMPPPPMPQQQQQNVDMETAFDQEADQNDEFPPKKFDDVFSESHYEGYLTKLTRGEGKRRWAVLMPDRLCLYINKGDREPKSFVPMPDGFQLVDKLDDKKERHMLTVAESGDEGTKVVELVFENREEKFIWFKAINVLRKRVTTMRQGSLMEGFMMKANSEGKYWKKRFFILTKDKLTYYKKRADKEPAGDGVTIADNGLVVNVFPDKNSDYPFMFGVQENADHDTRTFFIAPPTKSARNQWMRALRQLAATKPQLPKTVPDCFFEGHLTLVKGNKYRFVAVFQNEMRIWDTRQDAAKKKKPSTIIPIGKLSGFDFQGDKQFIVAENRRTGVKRATTEFEAASEADRDVWVTQLRDAVKDERERSEHAVEVGFNKKAHIKKIDHDLSDDEREIVKAAPQHHESDDEIEKLKLKKAGLLSKDEKQEKAGGLQKGADARAQMYEKLEALKKKQAEQAAKLASKNPLAKKMNDSTSGSDSEEPAKKPPPPKAPGAASGKAAAVKKPINKKALLSDSD